MDKKEKNAHLIDWKKQVNTVEQYFSEGGIFRNFRKKSENNYFPKCFRKTFKPLVSLDSTK